MRPLLVASLQHTGTMFVYDLLPGRHGDFHKMEPDHKYRAHYGEPGLAEAMEKCFVIVPHRRYAAVRESWARRKMDLKELDLQWKWYDTLENVFFLHIDDIRFRDLQLNVLSDLLEVPLSTSWKPLHSFSGAQSWQSL
jgi:hypothetical protein